MIQFGMFEYSLLVWIVNAALALVSYFWCPPEGVLVAMFPAIFIAFGMMLRFSRKDAFGLVQETFTQQVEQREAAAETAGAALEAAFDFMETAFGPGQEMVVFVTELALGPASGPFIAENGCERYDRYSQTLLLDSRRADLARRLANQAAQDAEAGLPQ